jgi:hypothetical protein
LAKDAGKQAERQKPAPNHAFSQTGLKLTTAIRNPVKLCPQSLCFQRVAGLVFLGISIVVSGT